MSKYYFFFVRDSLPKSDAHLIQIVQCANAAANLGYSVVLSFLDRRRSAYNPINWFLPFRPRRPDQTFVNFYNIRDRLQILTLAMPWPIDRFPNKYTNSSTITCKYYWPLHISSRTQLVHTRDWNFVKAAINKGIPTIYECHHHNSKRYEPDIVNSPLLQVAVTVIDSVRDSMVNNGMPIEKIVVVPNGYNALFLERQPQAAQEWRDQLLLRHNRRKLAVYGGALYSFKGIDQILEIAGDFPDVSFALAGGPEAQRQLYQQRIAEKQLDNVELLGFLPQRALSSLLQAADVLLHPHCSGEAAKFTSPLKLFDYMASGTPIIATRIQSLRSFEGTEAIAAWCDPDRPAALASCLRNVLQTTAESASNFPVSIDFVKQFSWENRIQKILEHVDPAFRPTMAA
ncbi:glycosyltransferase [Pleurocapsales cyanobacterium LEGE 06147]|nr:glycosyltransferase [Pleurocapsales cyanobacterium LEGE 06147]